MCKITLFIVNLHIFYCFLFGVFSPPIIAEALNVWTEEPKSPWTRPPAALAHPPTQCTCSQDLAWIKKPTEAQSTQSILFIYYSWIGAGLEIWDWNYPLPPPIGNPKDVYVYQCQMRKTTETQRTQRLYTECGWSIKAGLGIGDYSSPRPAPIGDPKSLPNRKNHRGTEDTEYSFYLLWLDWRLEIGDSSSSRPLPIGDPKSLANRKNHRGTEDTETILYIIAGLEIGDWRLEFPPPPAYWGF